MVPGLGGTRPPLAEELYALTAAMRASRRDGVLYLYHASSSSTPWRMDSAPFPMFPASLRVRASEWPAENCYIIGSMLQRETASL